MDKVQYFSTFKYLTGVRLYRSPKKIVLQGNHISSQVTHIFQNFTNDQDALMRIKRT